MATVISNNQARSNISQNVRRLLSLKDPPWKQADLARAAGENEMTISHLVRGTRLASAALLSRVAEVLGVTSDSLLATPDQNFLKTVSDSPIQPIDATVTNSLD